MKCARDERGWTLVIAMLLMTIMASMALATFAFVDREQEQSATTRKRETAYNLSEAVLNAQIFELSRDWPGVGAAALTTLRYPACTDASSGTHCPSATTISGLFASPDTASGMSWRTEVHDNNAPNPQFYSDDATSGTRAQPSYDANGDGKVWIRAQATVRGRTRTLIALVATQEQVEDLPHAALITGRLELGNNGHKILIDASGGSTASGFIAVRCTPALGEATPCLGHSLGGGLFSTLLSLLSLLNIQISPNVALTGYPNMPAMTSAAITRLRARARADGQLYASCPSSFPAAQVVFIESGSCSYTANGVVNSATAPGVVILENGATLTLRGTLDFYGIIYNTNTIASTSTLVDVGGNVVVHGGVLVDGQASTAIGESALNLRLDLGAFDALRSYGSAGIIQNTFREIKNA
jgi:type II secretory pathway pseudopilin PulG